LPITLNPFIINLLRQTIPLWKQRKHEGNSNYKCVVSGALRKTPSELWLRISHCPTTHFKRRWELLR